jgi:hypothetical protein
MATEWAKAGSSALIQEIIDGANAQVAKIVPNDAKVAAQMADKIKVALTGSAPKAAANAAANANAQRAVNAVAANAAANAQGAAANANANAQRAAAAANAQKAAAANANAKKSAEEKTIDEGIDTSFFHYQQYMKNDTGVLPDESSKEEFKKQLIATLNVVKGILKDKNVNDFIYFYLNYYGKNPGRTPAEIAKEIRLDVYGESEPTTGGYRKRSTRKHKKSRKHRKSRKM